ncbi:hypothetical protein FHU38_000993 [Saccharomonospora amisosensis]|uniref:Alkaline shock response membrane anchor protein AmaP n=1 Tax=Saccharomonospora amisosensis TaxID=1128677 RepID=A0A7X5UN06_9PSEU|nr:alkaline shock response membrane anchor protein AmaP [Saccharomonospora amisosensis]NIJ10649.1 hypothetical protein [Saccharomonospora amisosensis]
MKSVNRPSRLNRSLLAVVGAVLVAGGGVALSTYFGWSGLFEPTAPLVPGTQQPPTWALYVTAAVAVLVAVACLLWLAAQFTREPRTRTWHLETDPARGHTDIAPGTAVEPLVHDIVSYPGVHTADATLAGNRESPLLSLVVTTEQDADLTAVREQIAAHGLPRLRQALDLSTLPAVLEFRVAGPAGSRVS